MEKDKQTHTHTNHDDELDRRIQTCFILYDSTVNEITCKRIFKKTDK